MARWNRYRLKNPTRAYSIQKEADWGYTSGFGIDTDAGVVTVVMDRPERAKNLGIVFGDLMRKDWELGDCTFDNEVVGFVCFDRRIVAMVVDYYKTRKAGDPYPKMGEELHLPTEAEADALYEKYGIPTPQTSVACDDILCDSVEVGDDGTPLAPGAEE
ncbi:MAG: hypothetical protein K6F50_06195 [Kiritimatiellae bacterium]|nr:hypothetical protein [Kiritimatiellia bacterium]